MIEKHIRKLLDLVEEKSEDKTPKQLNESTGATDYNPKSQGGTRKELLAKYHKTKDPKDAEAARKAGATQQELQQAGKEGVAEDIASTRREVNLKKKIDKGVATPEQKKEYQELKAKNMGRPAPKQDVAEGMSAQDKNISVGDYVQTAAGVEGVVKHITPDGKKLTIWNRKRQADHRVDISKAEKIPGIARRKMPEQGVAEGLDLDTQRLEQEVRDALNNGDDYTAKQLAKMASTPEAKKYLLKIIKQEMYGTEPGQGGVMEGTETKWEVTYYVEIQSHDERPGEDRDYDETVTASSKEEAIAKVKKTAKPGAYNFTARQIKQDMAEGSILKSIKRGLQGWDKKAVGPGGEKLGDPREVVKRAKAMGTDTAKKFRAGLDNAQDHTPAGLQKRVLDRKLKDVAEGLDPDKRSKLDDLIDQYRNSVDPSYDPYDSDEHYDSDDIIDQIRSEFGDKIADQVEAGAEKMHFGRPGHKHGYDPLGWRKPIDRQTKAGKMFKQDSDYRKNMVKSRYKLSGKSATESVAEGGMPASVIKQKQQLADMSDKEFAEKYGSKSDEELMSMARRHGYGANSKRYVAKRNKGKEVTESKTDSKSLIRQGINKADYKNPWK